MEAPPSKDCSTDTKQGGQRYEALRKNEEKRALGKRPAKTALTMQKTVVFEAAAAEEGVEGVQGLLPLDRLRTWPIYVGSALRRQHVWVRHFRELPVPIRQTETPTDVQAFLMWDILHDYITIWASVLLAQIP